MARQQNKAESSKSRKQKEEEDEQNGKPQKKYLVGV